MGRRLSGCVPRPPLDRCCDGARVGARARARPRRVPRRRRQGVPATRRSDREHEHEPSHPRHLEDRRRPRRVAGSRRDARAVRARWNDRVEARARMCRPRRRSPRRPRAHDVPLRRSIVTTLPRSRGRTVPRRVVGSTALGRVSWMRGATWTSTRRRRAAFRLEPIARRPRRASTSDRDDPGLVERDLGTGAGPRRAVRRRCEARRPETAHDPGQPRRTTRT